MSRWRKLQKRGLFAAAVFCAFFMEARQAGTAKAAETQGDGAPSRQESSVCVFKEAKIEIPADWDGKYGTEQGEEFLRFYHTASREAAQEEKKKEAGELFTVYCVQDIGFAEDQDWYLIGAGSEGIYYVSCPETVQMEIEEEEALEEWITLSESAKEVGRKIRVEETDTDAGCAWSEELFRGRSAGEGRDSLLGLFRAAERFGENAEEAEGEKLPAEEILKETEQETVPQTESDKAQPQTENPAPQVHNPTFRMPETSKEPSLSETEKDEEYILPESSSRYLEEADVAGMDAEEVQMAINEIYARHHRKFQVQSVREYFESRSWYEGTIEPGEFSEAVFNEYESYNVAFLLGYL